MTITERNIKLKHFITCLKCEIHGRECDDNCPTQYEAGNMGEIIENLEEISKALDQQPSKDCISRQAALDAMETWDKFGCDPDGKLVRYDDDKHYIPYVHYEDMVHVIKHLPSAQPEQRWIPFKTRPLTKEEKEEHPEWDGILDCKLPDDGQRILVAIHIRGHEEVQQDEFYSDDGSYLDSGYEIGTEAVAWMPLPEAYRGGEQDGQ